MHISVTVIVALTMLSACSSAPRAAASQEIFDEQTGNTLLVVAKPLVFARTRSDVAAFARDYATLVAVEVDISGKYSDYLLLYRWSTVDPRMSAPPSPSQGELKILADGREIDLKPLEQSPVSLSRRKQLHVPDQGAIVLHEYKIDAATLRFIASSRDLTVRMPQESFDTPFTIYEDGRVALAQFAGRAGTQ
jgi:hypothetical protein